jgi:acetoin utilization protein AcuB
MLVKDVMTKDPITIDPEAALGTAVDVMRTKHVRHLPVVDDDGQIVGILTDRDLRHAVLEPAAETYLSTEGRRQARGLSERLADLRVRNVMTWGVVTVRPETSLAHAALIMSEQRVGSLPVVELGRVVGLLTEADVLRAVARGGALSEFDPEGLLW